jgi:hypothetical protein
MPEALGDRCTVRPAGRRLGPIFSTRVIDDTALFDEKLHEWEDFCNWPVTA